MVDRIVPATTAADLDQHAAALGLRDEAAVFTEGFTQWVIEDRFTGPRPHWEAGGRAVHTGCKSLGNRQTSHAQWRAFSPGLPWPARGYEFVHEAIADPQLRALVEHLMRDEAATSFTPAPEQDLELYADQLLRRFLPIRRCAIVCCRSAWMGRRKSRSAGWKRWLSTRQLAGPARPS